jgi:hypothetical protein
VCDRAIVIFGGRVVGEIAAADADEATLLRAAYNLRSDARMPEHLAAAGQAPAVAGAGESPGPASAALPAAEPSPEADR